LTVRVIAGDCLAEMAALARADARVDSVVTDPPYHLTSGNVSFDWDALKPGGAGGGRLTGSSPPTNKAGRGHKKSGFMGQRWDGGDITFRPETWAAAANLLRPGGFLLAFGGTRRFHRLACAIEDAGLVIQDTIMWLYGTGFPKRRDMLKPAWEPIIMAYKPAGKRSMQVDECRVETGTAEPRGHQRPHGEHALGRMNDDGWKPDPNSGRRTLQVDECRVEGDTSQNAR
jgi:site-specific DNA-methyltransferase (adenine-specific)